MTYKDPQGAVDIRLTRLGTLHGLSFRTREGTGLFEGGFQDLGLTRLVNDHVFFFKLIYLF